MVLMNVCTDVIVFLLDSKLMCNKTFELGENWSIFSNLDYCSWHFLIQGKIGSQWAIVLNGSALIFARFNWESISSSISPTTALKHSRFKEY